MTDLLGDGDNVMIGVRFPTGHELSAVVYIDHNVGTLVKDAFLIPEAIASVVQIMREKAPAETSFADIPAADAKVRITEAIWVAAMTVPPFETETETWPLSRPLVEWIVGLLPDGGRGYEAQQWSEDERQALGERFWASPFAVGLEHRDHRDLFGQIVWFGCDYGPGDPMRWSPVAIEILLADWIPRKITGDVAYLAKAPELLRAFVRFCHAARDIPAHLTDETLGAVDRWEPVYQDAIRSPRPQGPEALLVAMGAMDPDGPWTMPGDDERGRTSRRTTRR